MSSTGRLEGFPPATEATPVIYHSGLTDEERAEAERLGYRCEDVRFIAGISGIKATLLGLRMGTVVMTREQIAALRAEAEVWEKVPEELETAETEGAKAAEDLLASLRGNDSYASLWRGVREDPPKRPRGRPRKL